MELRNELLEFLTVAQTAVYYSNHRGLGFQAQLAVGEAQQLLFENVFDAFFANRELREKFIAWSEWRLELHF